jgi:hypothetical protein
MGFPSLVSSKIHIFAFATVDAKLYYVFTAQAQKESGIAYDLI